MLREQTFQFGSRATLSPRYDEPQCPCHVRVPPPDGEGEALKDQPARPKQSWALAPLANRVRPEAQEVKGEKRPNRVVKTGPRTQRTRRREPGNGVQRSREEDAG